MDALEEHTILEITDTETAVNSNTKIHDPELSALLSVKKFTDTLEKDYAELLKIESELDELNRDGLLIIEATTSPEATTQWKAIVQEMNTAISGINDTLTAAKENIAQKEKNDSLSLWTQLTVHVTAFKDNAKNAANTALNFLPEAVHPQWEKEFATLQTPLVESLVTHVESCRVLLQLIERYTPEELNAITQMIVDHIPVNFTYEEALKYQNEYYKALVDYKKEFKEEKNLWDKFLDVLAGGTHQSPSERVMLERWIEGEKGDL
ncbi:hypothetical protein [Haliscomenobacter hydrossis]|uniref:Uncharacterized protein n=1 Tax=Haliscomenobacter hydrossis (strain ATCC 27775 / DSM 1100 / LMG 10767 / O) TaxID=760192 RepID=F4KSB6_HALH1|nr:hypothetical protein [Haliscomenobacter hydrossis]AEE53319.1 hypothetical protein Halhy_5494 [Haliscomenobacter hydrossis DSM 1100]